MAQFTSDPKSLSPLLSLTTATFGAHKNSAQFGTPWRGVAWPDRPSNMHSFAHTSFHLVHGGVLVPAVGRLNSLEEIV
jgi:hypothetical protein